MLRLHKRHLLIAGLIIIASLIFYFHKKILAENKNPGLTISPPTFELSAQPGKTTTNTVRLENWSDHPMEIVTKVKNFSALGEEGEVNITTENIPYSLSPWVTLTPTHVTLPPGGKQVFTFTITPPANAEPGGHFGALVFSTIPPTNTPQTAAFVSQEVTSLLLVKIPGDVTENAIIYSFDSDKNFYEFGPVNFTAAVRNESNVHIHPIGAIIVSDLFGRKTQVEIESRNILPNAIRNIHSTWQKTLLIGPYTAKIILSYGEKNQTITNSTEFFAFPWRYGLVGLGILIILFLMRKRLWRAGKALITGK